MADSFPIQAELVKPPSARGFDQALKANFMYIHKTGRKHQDTCREGHTTT